MYGWDNSWNFHERRHFQLTSLEMRFSAI